MKCLIECIRGLMDRMGALDELQKGGWYPVEANRWKKGTAETGCGAVKDTAEIGVQCSRRALQARGAV